MHLKIMKVVMNPEWHRPVLFSRAERKRNGEKSSMLNPGSVSGLLCLEKSGLWRGRKEAHSGSTTYSVHDLRILFTFLSLIYKMVMTTLASLVCCENEMRTPL